MNRFTWMIIAIGLSIAPANAQDTGGFFSQLVGGQTAQAPSRTRATRDASEHQDRGSFMAMTSWYGGGPRRYEPNTHTASGERFNKWGLTAAHRTLPMGTHLLISSGERSVVVRVNDRGPAAWTGRSLDVSKGAAARLGLLQRGTGHVHVTVLGRG
jgi:rare lipoprotein A